MKLPLYLRVLLLLTLAGCGWLFLQDTPDNSVNAPVRVLAKPAEPTPVSTPEPVTSAVIDLFPAQTWAPPPPPPPTPVDNSPPKPPPMPFSVTAQWRYENQSKIVVLRGNNTQYTLCNRCSVPGSIVPGKMLDAHYRLDKLTDTAVVLTYMPLKHASTLRLDTH